MKICELEKEESVLREKDIVNELQHNNIIRLLETFKVSISYLFFIFFIQDEKNLYFVFEHCPNGSLDEFIKKYKLTLGRGNLCRIYMAQLVNAVEYMQTKGIMERDLKPGNIMLDDYYKLKIIDYGDAK